MRSMLKKPLIMLFVLAAGCAASGKAPQTRAVGENKPRQTAQPATAVVKGKAFNSIATEAMARAAEEKILSAEGVSSRECAASKIIAARVVEEPKSKGKMWVERWTTDRCGMIVQYRARFLPKSGKGAVIVSRSNEPMYIIEKSRKLKK